MVKLEKVFDIVASTMISLVSTNLLRYNKDKFKQSRMITGQSVAYQQNNFPVKGVKKVRKQS